MINFKSEKFKALHAGWLLACSSDKNKEKGLREFDLLTTKGKDVAIKYMEECLAIYAEEDR
jgi:hypothetical protein